jgi:endonuclease YncB( thermonuclease family)
MHWLLLLLSILPSLVLAETLEGRVVRIIDGDTLVLLDANNTQHRIRLSGIDTPERGQPFGKRATQNLARLSGNKPARLEWYKRDRWKRLIGKIWVHSPDTRCQDKNCPLNLDVGMDGSAHSKISLALQALCP